MSGARVADNDSEDWHVLMSSFFLGWGENDRGVSFTFGPEVVAKFLHKHDLDLICRAHQVSI